MSGEDRISPTAHYTGHVWSRNRLSPPELSSWEGRLLYESLRGVNAVNLALGGDSLENYLLARHRSIDLLLEQAIEASAISQVIEVACGLSPRGWRFARRYGDRIDYVEADLPGMARRKRAALARAGSLGSHHRVVEIDALTDGGPNSLEAVAAELDPGRGTAIITEGLLGYLDDDSVVGLWRRTSAALRRFPAGRYYSDLHLGAVQNLQIRVFRVLLAAFVRGEVHLHFESAEQGRDALCDAGFDGAQVHSAAELAGPDGGRGSQLVHIIEAWTGGSAPPSSATRPAPGRTRRTPPSG